MRNEKREQLNGFQSRPLIRSAVMLGMAMSGSWEEVYEVLRSENLGSHLAMAASRMIGKTRNNVPVSGVLVPSLPLRLEDAQKLTIEDCQQFIQSLVDSINTGTAWDGGPFRSMISDGGGCIGLVLPVVVTFEKRPELDPVSRSFESCQLLRASLSLEHEKVDDDEDEFDEGRVAPPPFQVLDFDFFLKSIQKGVKKAIEHHKEKIVESIQSFEDDGLSIDEASLNGLDFNIKMKDSTKIHFSSHWIEDDHVRQRLSMAVCHEVNRKEQIKNDASDVLTEPLISFNLERERHRFKLDRQGVARHLH